MLEIGYELDQLARGVRLAKSRNELQVTMGEALELVAKVVKRLED